ncbi:hypothetical protein Bcon01_73030 [Burkholderia contaminans]|nr:hypothetical protein Bcon01_73030 [Burkholderia contaminans]
MRAAAHRRALRAGIGIGIVRRGQRGAQRIEHPRLAAELLIGNGDAERIGGEPAPVRPPRCARADADGDLARPDTDGKTIIRPW